MRLAARWLSELLDDAFAIDPPPSRGSTLSRSLTHFAHVHGLVLGAPIVRAKEKLLPSTGGLSPLIRFILVVTDAARIAARRTGQSDAVARRHLLVALALLVDDEKLARVFIAADAKPKQYADATIALGQELRRRRMLFGNPIVGLTLIYGLTAIDGMLVVEMLTLLAHGIPLGELPRFSERARAARVLFVAEIAALTRERPGLEMALDVAAWQVKKLGLARRESLEARSALDGEWDRDRAQRALDRAMRQRIFHATMLVAHLDGVETDEERRFLRTMGESYGMRPTEIQRVRRRVLAFIEYHRDALNPLEKAVGFEIDGAPVSVKVARALRTGSASVFTEIKETGDLALLLAKKAAGQDLSDDESARMWDQLKDVARVVPSLAVFTLPGGALLLPLLYRLLPFDIRPSSFRPGRFRAFGDEEATIAESGEPSVVRARGDDVEAGTERDSADET
jgi:hypothetical protein